MGVGVNHIHLLKENTLTCCNYCFCLETLTMSDLSSDDECPDLIPVPERPVPTDDPAYKIPVTIITGFLGKHHNY